MKKYYLGLDQGTTGTTAMIFDEKWNKVSRGYKEHTQYFPEPGWVEHDPLEIWRSILDVIDMAATEAGIQKDELTCMGLDNQGETVMLWDKVSGTPVYNAIVWQDRRTAQYADQLANDYGEKIREKTGLVVDAYFSGTKIKWIIDNVEGVKEKIEKGRIIAGTLDTWMIWKLTHGKVCITDYSTASRTMLLNIHTGKWDDEILEWMGIPKSILPEIHDSSELYGYTDPLDFFGACVPISGSVVDQQAALFGQACFKEGTVKTTYGTGCFMLMNTGKKAVYSKNGLLTTVGWGLNKGKITFALDAGIYIAGAAVQWLRDKLKIIESASETEAMAKSVPDTAGVYFVPAFSGLAAPHWDQYARGTMVGITGGTEKEHIVRATLESMAYQVKDNLDVMEKDSGIPIKVMRVDGGAVQNEFLMQFQADILGIPVEVPVITDTTALGAAYLAAYGINEFHNIDELEQNWKLYKRYEPNMDDETRNRLLNQWHRAVERAKKWEEA
ncbi:glycerol kinase [Aequitasia blattaphilus]|uniref:Glycerol kinase n=1 Tax=Aequitasia blattaphilus TaxID=2949332 RepID=A0ABT1ECM5_9FIRM|nr:glycerol kinase GlpK [Aequitasia blattaphilus]MCP1103421.1 glycerol kinase GlpK [Aequitasia blattaphilus]MCR8616061.1 glycerol kinase GlpK [Aequitasia blattaphilus]